MGEGGPAPETEHEPGAVAEPVADIADDATVSFADTADPIAGNASRRQGERRDSSASRSPTGADLPRWRKRGLPESWPYLIVAMVGAISAGIVFGGGIPDAATMILLALSLLLVSMVRPLVRVMGDTRHGRMAAMALVALLPLLLFGMGMTRWASTGGIRWEHALGALLSVNCIATIYLRRRPEVIFLVQLCTWLAAVTVYPSMAGWSLLAVTLGMAVLVGREQARQDEEDEENRQAEDRINSRARDVLTDYEETRQGWFWETDRRGLLTYVSPPVAQELGHTALSMIGQPLIQLFDLNDTGQDGERTLMFHLSARSSFQELAVRAAIPGERRWWSISGRPVYDGFNNFVGFRGSGTDLTERRRSQEQANRLAHYDSLTGLANRFLMSQSLEKILATPRAASRACAVMLLDLDRFKQVNDTMGHPAGDALLQQVARRLQREVAAMGQVGRLGGDEFKVIVPAATDRHVLGHLCAAIIHSLSQPYSIDGQRVTIGASIGVAIAPDDGESSEALIRNADLALYAAKDGGRGRYHFYSDDLHAEAEAKAHLEEELRDAVQNGQLQLFYQPYVSTRTEEIAGFEALLRWHHPVKGWISPDRFVPTAEESGLIAQIGEWAMRTACHDAATWPDNVRVAVNVSPLQFSNPQLPAIVTSAIAQAGIAAGRLELEITESVFLTDNAGTDAMFAALKAIGVRLALDDFGTGYSSLGYLKKAPFDKIKIDQSFVRGATRPGSRNGAIIASITGLAHALGMDTTAEGVETLDELDLVRLHGCSHVQGYIYEKALDRTAALERLGTGLDAVAQGPRSARMPRQTMLRKVVLHHAGNRYNGTIRNISTHGAMIEGLWNVPPGTLFEVQISDRVSVQAKTRWSRDDRMGVEFTRPLARSPAGAIVPMQARAADPVSPQHRP